jgi:LppX_LprAFG lipoprotein
MIMRSTAAVLAGVAAVALSACGGSSEGLSLDPIADAASKTMSSSGERVHMRAAISVTWSGGTYSWGTMEGDGLMTSKAADLTIQVAPYEGPSFTLREVYLIQTSGPVIYLSSPQLSRRLPRGKPWLRIDVGKFAREFGAKVSNLPQTNDPSQFLRLLRERGLRPERRGEATIDGQKTTRYHVDVDVEQAMRKLAIPKASARWLRQQLKSKTIPIDAWVAEDGYLRREHVTLATRARTMWLTMTLSDFGRDVSIEPPPAEHTVDSDAPVG